MANFTYLSEADNLILGAAVSLSATSNQDTAFPVANLTTLPLSRPYRSSDGADQRILIDLGAAPHAINVVSVLNHNIRSSGSITVRRGNGSNPTGNAQVLTVNRYEERVSFFIYGSNQTNRHWSVTLSDTGNPDGPLRAGYIMLGQTSVLPFQFAFPYRLQRMKRQRYIETELGAPIVGETIYNSLRAEFSFESLSPEEANTTELFLRDLDLMRHPVLIAPTGAASEEVFFARLQKPQEREFHTEREHINDLGFISEPMGRTIS